MYESLEGKLAKNKTRFVDERITESNNQKKSFSVMFCKFIMASIHFSVSSPPIFNEEKFPIWSIKIKSYLQAFDL